MRRVLAFFAFMYVGSVGAATPADLRAALAATLDALPSGATVGCLVVDAADGALLYARNPDQPFKPASVMKLLTTAAALERFGPDFVWRTRGYVSGDEVWLAGGGDPGLGDPELARRRGRPWDRVLDDWAGRVRIAAGGAGLHKLVLDDALFDREARHPDWDPDQSDRWYCAPVGALNYYDNCVTFRAAVRQGRVVLKTDPPLPASFLDNQLRVGRRYRATLHRPFESDIFRLRGTIAKDAVIGTASVGRPSIFVGHALRREFEKRGVTFHGPVVRRRIPADRLAAARAAFVHETTLAEALWRCNTFSQNMFAECVLKSLAAYDPNGRPSGAAGSWAGGTRVLRATLEGCGVSLDGAVLRDGSGLSHQNRLSARHVVDVLQAMRRHRHGAMFVESLADAGDDGTLRKYRDGVFAGRLSAKTGTLAGVRTLAGYVERADGAERAFALLINGRVPSSVPREVARILVE